MPQLLHLPNQVLDRCLAQLLPPLIIDNRPTSLRTLVDWTNSQHPTDLCRLMVVCKALYKLTLPWVWRRVMISYEDSSADSGYPSQWAVLCRNPGVACYTRLLVLDARNDDPTPSELTGLFPAIKLMDNLQVLIFFCCCPNDPRKTIDDIFTELTSKPQLHTLISSYFPPHDLPTRPALKNVGCVDISTPGWAQGLIEMARDVESIMVANTRTVIDDEIELLIPWDTIRQVEFSGVQNWDGILDSYDYFKEEFPDVPSALEELSICAFRDIGAEEGLSITLEQLDWLLTTFEGQLLHTLCFCGVPFVNVSLCDEISRSFPRLQNLSLFSRAWCDELPTIAESLAQLPMLKLFSSDYADHEFPLPITTTTQKRRYRDILAIIADRCQALKYVKFYYLVKQWTCYTIERDSIGRYKSYIEEDNEDIWGIQVPFCSTSAWDTRRYNVV